VKKLNKNKARINMKNLQLDAEEKDILRVFESGKYDEIENVVLVSPFSILNAQLIIGSSCMN
jgi:hypothetical protein